MIHRTNDNSICMTCLTVLNRASNMEGESAAPEIGDIGICIECAAVGTYNDNLSLEPITRELLDEIKNESPEGYNEIAITVASIKHSKGIE